MVRLAAAIFLTTVSAATLPAQNKDDLFELEERAVRDAVDRVAPSVVRIDTVGGLEHLDDVLLGEGPTTGVVVDADGWIVSSTFNFLRLPSSILVTLPGNRRVPARIVARDHSRKLVLLKVETEQPLPVPESIPADEVLVGQSAIAVGRTFHADKPNISTGIISARQRIWGKAIQTDAKISPSNYGGPLCDLRGRVFGILVPLSPTSQHELAGAEWYDAGIGFAVPLVDIRQRLERMKKGEDLQPGLLGVTLKSGDMYSLPVELVACHPKSPAYRAGLRAGDTIVEVNGISIERQAQLKHVLGPLYAGETLSLIARRGEERITLKVELVDAIQPYEQPFLGILPQRQPPADGAAGPDGVPVRYVYPGSGAAQAGLKPGDRIRRIGERATADATALREALAALEPDQAVEVTVQRGDREERLQVTLGSAPDRFPPAEASAATERPVEGRAQPAELKIPEEPNECTLLVPANDRGGSPLGLLVVLSPPGDFDADGFAKQWAHVAQQYGLIVAAPRARLANMWLPAETDVIRKVIDHVVQNYRVDRDRVAVHGTGASGAMAYLTAFRLRDVVRGIVAIDAAIPLLVARPPDVDPIERLGVVLVRFAESPAKSRMEQNASLLREMKYPVIDVELPGAGREVNDETQAGILRWLDTLDKH